MQRLPTLRRFLRSRTWAVLRLVIGVCLGLLALEALNGQRGELVGASSELAHLRVGWLLLAIALELGSFFSFGQLQRRLLHAGAVEMSRPLAAAMSLAAGAIADSLPAGPAFASVWAFRLYRRCGADDTIAGWTLLATLVCAAVTLALLATAGVGLALQQSSSYDLVGVILAVLVISVVADAVVLQRRWLARALIGALALSHRLIGRPRRHGDEIVEATAARLGVVRMRPGDLVNVFSAAMMNWVCDCGALAASFLAVGVGVPWRGLLLTYGAAQLAANLPITPGGLGVVEGTITIALVAFGGSERSIVAAVICYRVVSFWGFLPFGWATWAAVSLARRRADARAARAARAPLGPRGEGDLR